MMQPHPEKALGEAMEKGGKKMIGLAKDEPCEYGEALCLFGESACQVNKNLRLLMGVPLQMSLIGFS